MSDDDDAGEPTVVSAVKSEPVPVKSKPGAKNGAKRKAPNGIDELFKSSRQKKHAAEEARSKPRKERPPHKGRIPLPDVHVDDTEDIMKAVREGKSCKTVVILGNGVDGIKVFHFDVGVLSERDYLVLCQCRGTALSATDGHGSAGKSGRGSDDDDDDDDPYDDDADDDDLDKPKRGRGKQNSSDSKSELEDQASDMRAFIGLLQSPAYYRDYFVGTRMLTSYSGWWQFNLSTLDDH